MMMTTTIPFHRFQSKSSARARGNLLSLSERGDAADEKVERILLEHFWRPSPQRLARVMR